MHENFLSYIMIGLSRGLFPSTPRVSSRFDEEAYLRQEARLLRRERQAEAWRQPKPASVAAATEAQEGPETGRKEPGSRLPAAFCRHGAMPDDAAIGFAGSQSCRVA